MTQTPPENTPSQTNTPSKRHRHDPLLTHLQRGLLAIGVLTVVILLALLVPRTPGQVSIIGDMFTICLVICPLLLCLAPIYVLLAVAAFYTNKLNNYTGNKLGILSNAAKQARTTTERVSGQVGSRTIGWRARFAIFEEIINGEHGADAPATPDQKHTQTEKNHDGE